MYWIDKLLIRKTGYNFIFPYSDDYIIRRQQLIKNLENGVLFEDLKLFIEWKVPFRNLQRYVRKKQKIKSYKDSGCHIILDGLEVFLNPHEAMMNSLPFIDVISFLGFDEAGHKRYSEVKSHLVDRFGEPSKVNDTLPFYFHGDNSAWWIYSKFQIVLNVWERFAVHYSLSIEAL